MKGLSFLLCLIWGFNFVIMKLGNGAFPPAQFAAFRFLTGTLLLFGLMLWKKTFLPPRGDMKWFFLCGLLQTMYFNIAIQISLQYINAGLTSVLTYSMPLFLSFLAHYFIPDERLHTMKLIGVITGIAGLFIAMDIHLGGNLWAMLLGLSSAVSWALSNLIIKLKLQHSNKLQFTSWQMLSGTAGLFLYSIFFEHGQARWSIASISYILFSGILASALAFLLWSHILSRTEASKASITLLLVPVVGIISGWIFLHEQLKGATIVGIALVLVGIWLVNHSGKLQKTASIKRGNEV